MKKSSFVIPKIVFLAFTIICVSACIKNDNFIKGDAKIRIFQSASTDTTQNFFLNGVQTGSATVYGTNSTYIVVGGDSTYKITSRNINTSADVATLANQKLDIGKNYSVYYTRETATTPPSLKLYEDDVRKDVDSAKLVFLHLGYTLGSPVIITDSIGSFPRFTMTYGNKITKKIKVKEGTKISFVLTTPTTTNPQPVVTALISSTILNGNVYTILIDGSKTGELQKRLVTSN